jgi:C-terminal processing protease CtpA/Prc
MGIGPHRSLWAARLLLGGFCAVAIAPAQAADTIGTAKPEAAKTPSKGPAARDLDGVARTIFAITDVVLDHHIQPVSRQEMILSGLRGAFAWKNLAAPELGRRVSDLRTTDELSALLKELWPKLTQNGTLPSGDVENALLTALLSSVPGSPHILPAKEVRVHNQIQANRYIGIGIAIRVDEKTKLPQIAHAQPGGPAQLGGVRDDDLIEQINHSRVEPNGKLRDVVDALRGPEGTQVTIQVRQPQAKESRTLTLVRLPVMFKSVQCSEQADEDHVVLLHTKPVIAYLKISSVTASTARELAAWEPRLREAKVQALILDLRETGGSDGFDNYHAALLLADSLLDGKPLGKLRRREGGTREYTADRECLFRDWPLAILIDKYTSGPAEWVAAALQDSIAASSKRRHVTIVGTPSGKDAFVRSAYPLPSGDDLILADGVWERPKHVAEHKQRVHIYASPGDGSDWTMTETDAKGSADSVIPDAYVYLTDPEVGVQDLLLAPVKMPQPRERNGRVLPQKAPPKADKDGVVRRSPASLDAYEQAAVSELQMQFDLAPEKR